MTTTLGSSRASSHFVIDPDHAFVTLWRAIVFFIMVYYFYQIPFRIAFLPETTHPLGDSLTAVDTTCDIVFVNMYLKWAHFGYKDNTSGKITEGAANRKHYVRGQLKIDLLSMLPTYFGEGPSFARALSRALSY